MSSTPPRASTPHPKGPRPTSPLATPATAAASYTPPKGGLYAVASGIPDHSKCGENCSLNHNQYMKKLGIGGSGGGGK